MGAKPWLAEHDYEASTQATHVSGAMAFVISLTRTTAVSVVPGMPSGEKARGPLVDECGLQRFSALAKYSEDPQEKSA